MSSTHYSSPNQSCTPSPSTSSSSSTSTTDPSGRDAQVRLLLFGLCVAMAAVTFVGGVYSLLCLLRMRERSSLCVIVASLSVDDLLSVVPLSLFLLLQWDQDRAQSSVSLCTLSGLLYVFQGVSSNMKACLIAAYTFSVTKTRFGVLEAVCRPLTVGWAVLGVWAVSLAVSVLPLCGWGSFTPSSLGCFPESGSFYVLLLFSLYSLCFCGLFCFFAPLTYQLLCSREPHRTLMYPSFEEMEKELQSFSRDSLNSSFGTYNELSPGSCGTEQRQREDSGVAPEALRGQGPAAVGDTPVGFAQKRFSMILAMVRVVLWMPMMTLVLVRHAVNVRSSSLETLSFFLTLLAPAVTPLFVLSEHWIHLPCGCFIHCKREPTKEPSAMMKRKIEFNLSFQQGYGVYKLSHAKTMSPPIKKPAYHSLFNCDFSTPQLDALQSARLPNMGANLGFSLTCPVDTCTHAEPLLEAEAGGGAEATADGLPLSNEQHRGDDQFQLITSLPLNHQGHHHHLIDPSSVFEGPERRLSHEESRNIELTDWEWCRSKSERTPRQRSAGGLSIPLCAFQGTVSLQAPTGKTLSLSTYEISSDGLKISPNNAKKVEVYRSKSVGHEPSADDPTSQGQTRDVNVSSVGLGMEMGRGGGVGDTNVKIHLEVLEICDNEEAMDSVSIISNISQSSTHARSPSLRYSRRENRFVSCDLGETASYSLLIPGSSGSEAETMNITIPDTVEAHRQNSRRQTQGGSGYQEEIQLLNEAYRKQVAEREE